MKHYIVELIGAINNCNPKVRSQARELFVEICEVMRVDLNSMNQLFVIILVGLAGKK